MRSKHPRLQKRSRLIGKQSIKAVEGRTRPYTIPSPIDFPLKANESMHIEQRADPGRNLSEGATIIDPAMPKQC